MLVAVGDVEIWVESIPGHPGRAPVLFVSGADTPCSRWPVGLVAGVCEAGFPVTLFDHRDIGRSSAVSRLYSFSDLVDDTVGLLDVLEIGTVHLVGSSLGGMIGQNLALDHADRVVSLTLVISSPDPHRLRLSAASSAWEQAATDLAFTAQPDDDEARAERAAETARLLAGSRYEFDVAATRKEALEELRCGWSLESGHGLALAQAEPWMERLGDIAVPTLIVHGDSDPLFHLDHAEALAAGIADTELLVLEGLGHEVPSAVDLLAPLLEHLRGEP